MSRKPTSIKMGLTIPRETLEAIDDIADSFEDFVSRGEVIEMAFDYILDDEARTAEAFGPDEKGDEGEEEAT